MTSLNQVDPSQYPDIFHCHMATIAPVSSDADTSGGGSGGDTVHDVMSTGFFHDRDAVIDKAHIIMEDTDATLALGYLEPRAQGRDLNPSTISSAELTLLTSGVDPNTASGVTPTIKTFTFLTTAAAATGVIKILDGVNATGDTVTIVDTAGKSLVYKCIASGGDANGVVQADGSIAFVQDNTAGTVATNFAAAVNAATGHGTTITAAVQNTDEVLLTQDVAGRGGNTEMVSSDNADIQVLRNFAGGRNANEPGFVPKDAIVYLFDSETNLPNNEGVIRMRYRDRFA